MKRSDIVKRLCNKEIDTEDIAEELIEDPDLLPGIVDGISSENADVRFRSAKILSIVSETAPQILYPKFDLIAELLDIDNKIIKWNAIDVLANLATGFCEGERIGFCRVPG